MEKKLNEILATINGFYHYADDMVQQYISLINQAIEIIREIKTPPASMLEYAKNDAITELSKELANRLDESFFHAPVSRRKSEFKISRMLVGVAIENVLTHTND
jgi:hypothetical protein